MKDTLQGETNAVSLDHYEGKVLLVYNSAALCGATPQLEGLQVLEDQYGAQGLRVAGFYSDNFGQQGGSDEQIAGVTSKYGVKHDQFRVAPVVGEDARPVFAWLLSQDNPGPKEGAMAPTWNFFKWLISREGKVVAAFDMRTHAGNDPTADAWKSSPLVQAIEAELKA